MRVTPTPFCAGVGTPALRVAVSEAATGSKLLDSVVVTAQRGTSSFTLRRDGDVFTGPVDESGTFTVTVQRPRFQTWTRDGVVVRANSCRTPETVTLAAQLQPQ